MLVLLAEAPDGAAVVDYDRQQLALYAELLGAADAGQDWQWAAEHVMGIDADAAGAETCWRSHLDRARWIVDDGMGAAIEAFGRRPAPTN